MLAQVCGSFPPRLDEVSRPGTYTKVSGSIATLRVGLCLLASER